MLPNVLAAKLRAPPQDHHLVSRARLQNAIESELPRHKLILVSAPAGYGKTTLLAQWAQASRDPVVWLSLDEKDNDFDQFFRCLLAGWDRAHPGVIDSPLGMLLGATSPDHDKVLTATINLASELPGRTVFVLDDYDLIDDPAIHEAVVFLLDHLPSTSHIVLAVRREPPLPLARYRARGQLLEIRTEDLQFRIDETAAFFRQQAGSTLDDAAIESLYTRMEGWIAGLQLAALTRRRWSKTSPPAFGGRHRFVADYLSHEVLTQQPDIVQDFLLQTSILDRLSAPLCNAVTDRHDSQNILETLERENVFVVPLDDDRDWYRYHRPFSDFLKTELTRRHEDDVTTLHRRAAEWYFARDRPQQAFDHALAGDDAELVSRIFERYINSKLMCGELRDVASWLDALPAEWYATHPLLGLARAGLLAFSGAFAAALQCIDDVEQQLASIGGSDTGWQMAMTTSVRCFLACIQNDLVQAEQYADQALRDLRDDSRSFRATIYRALGDTYRRNGRWSDARACYLTVPGIINVPGFQVQATVEAVHVYGALADLELQQGHLHRAADYWRKALAAIQDPASWGRLELPLTGWVSIRMAEVEYEWNRLDDARAHLSHGLELVELGGDVRSMTAAYLMTGQLQLANRDKSAAAESVERARPLVEAAPFPEWLSRFERLQLEVWLAEDRLRAAVTWADDVLNATTRQERPESDIAHLALARVLIVSGDSPSLKRAHSLLMRVRETAESEDRVRVQIEALALLAMAHARRGEPTMAMTTLARALRLAEPEGYVRLFADLGLPMARLLQEARARGVLPDYVTQLLGAMDSGLAIPDSPVTRLPEPLTDREHEILELIAAGLTNPEIAARLFISPQTVGKHAGNIFGKLGVHTRTEAVARARALNLLS